MLMFIGNFLLFCVLAYISIFYIDDRFKGLFLKRFSMNLGIKKSKALYEDLICLKNNLLAGSKDYELTEYKFYTEIIYGLLRSNKKYGTNINEFLPSIKKALILETKFERKILNEFRGALLQMVFISSSGLCFTLFAFKQIGKSIAFADLLVPLTLQAFGVLIFTILFFLIRRNTFYSIQIYIKRLYEIRVYLFAKVPLGEINNCIKSLHYKDKELLAIKKRIDTILKSVVEVGRLDILEIDEAIEELWFFNEYKFENFLKNLILLKMLIIIFFFMSGFMMQLMSLLSYLAI